MLYMRDWLGATMADNATVTTNASFDEAAAARLNAVRAKSVEDWQKSTLPFVKWGIGILAVIVFLAVIFAGARVLESVENGSTHSQMFANRLSDAVGEDYPNVARLNSALRSYEAAREQDRAGAELLTRELLRFSSFLIGAALCFVGSIFVMGKFSDVTPTTAGGEHGSLKGNISTASPGLFALMVGAALVGIGVFAHYPVAAQKPQAPPQQPTLNSPNGAQGKSAVVTGWEAQMNEIFPEKTP